MEGSRRDGLRYGKPEKKENCDDMIGGSVTTCE